MAKIKIYEYKDKKTAVFTCPGCNESHGVTIGVWTFNGDVDKPTFRPSILARYPKLTEQGQIKLKQWSEDGFPERKDEPFDTVEVVCHSYVTEGRIEFLSDSTHSLAGQTVDLPDRDE